MQYFSGDFEFLGHFESLAKPKSLTNTLAISSNQSDPKSLSAAEMPNLQPTEVAHSYWDLLSQAKYLLISRLSFGSLLETPSESTDICIQLSHS